MPRFTSRVAARRPLAAARAAVCSAALCASASAQLIDHTFDGGSNPDGWVAWDSSFNSIPGTGGAPLDQLVLNNVGGAPTCQLVIFEPFGTGPFDHTGERRAAGVENVSADINIRQGAYDGIFCVFLQTFNGTPADTSDDCYLILILDAPTTAGWTHYDFPIPSSQTVAPPGWFATGPCDQTPIDQVWNSTLTSVDRMFFVLDAVPGASCMNTNWELGVDNISVQQGTLGSVYCQSLPNSTGVGAEIIGRGSRTITDNDVTFDVVNLPRNSFGYFVMSRTTGRTPTFSGNLCLGGTIYRHSAFVQQAGAAGTISYSPDLTALPQGQSFVPGETWNFQYWNRDAPSTANFSEAMAITFE